MSLRTLFFEPLDVLVFRDHRPFVAGQHFLARSTFPLPTVFFGALRAALFERQPAVDFSRPQFGLTGTAAQVLGDADNPGLLHLTGPLLAKLPPDAGPLTIFYPWPQDLVLLETRPDEPDERPPSESTRNPTAALTYPEEQTQELSLGLRWDATQPEPKMVQIHGHLPRSSASGKPSKERYLLTAAGAHAYAEASARGLRELELTCCRDCVLERSILEEERRTGIARRVEDGVDTLTVDESMLFTVETWRFQRYAGFACGVDIADGASDEHRTWLIDQLDALDGGIVRLGGKGHLARVRCLEQDSILPKITATEAVRSNSHYKIWLLTPALIDPANLAHRPSLALAQGIRVGGVRLRDGKHRSRGPKPLVSALDRGSVLFYAGPVRDPAALAREIAHPQRDPDDALDHPLQAGFGLHCILPYKLSDPSENRP